MPSTIRLMARFSLILQLRGKLTELVSGKIPTDVQKSLSDILEQLQRVEKELVQYQEELKLRTPPLAGP